MFLGTLRYQMLTEKYLNDACDVTRKTVFNGSISQSIGLPNDPEALEELDSLPRVTAKDGVTIIAVDETTDRVVGVAFNKILQKNQSFLENFKLAFKKAKSIQIIDFLLTTDSICDLFEHCNVECLMEILFLGTLPEYRKQGIAKKLSQLSICVAQELFTGHNVKQSIDDHPLTLEPVPEVVTAVFTSFISQKIGRELGFTTAMKRTHEDITGKKSEHSPFTTVEYKFLK